MRLWTIHPRYLDAKGLVAAWREALLAQAVLNNATKGYMQHPQLIRFKSHARPLAAIATFLAAIAAEAEQRGYQFDAGKITLHRVRNQIPETRGQLLYEWNHLKTKLRARDPKLHREFQNIEMPDAHPLFVIVPGKIRDWEKI